MNTTNVLGFFFVNSGIPEAVENALRTMERREAAYAVGMDAEKLLKARRNRHMESAVQGAAFLLPEGGGIVGASHILGLPLRRSVSMQDFASALMARMSEKGMKVAVLGQEGPAAALAAEKIKARYPGIAAIPFLRVDYDNNRELIDAVNACAPGLLLVGLGSPKQEFWMYRCQEAVQAGLMLGYGKELALLAGLAPQAAGKGQGGWALKTAKGAQLFLAAAKQRLFG